MKDLQELYEMKNPQNKAFVFRKLANLKYKEGSSMAEHLNVFQSLVNQLSTMKIAFDDEVQALFLLSSLPDCWNTMVVTLCNNAPNGKLTLNMVKESIFNEETRRKGFGLAPSLSRFMFGSTTFRAQLTNVSLKLANEQGKTFILTPSMLHGQAHRSMEVVTNAELMLSAQDDHKFESRSDATSSDAHESQEQGKVEENGLAEPCISSNGRYPLIDSDHVMPLKDSLISNGASDSVIQNGVSQPQYKKTFRMNALEDYVDMDDEDDLPSNGIVSPPLLEGRKEQVGALTNSNPSSAGEVKLVKSEIQQEVEFTSSISCELKSASSTGAGRSNDITTPTSEVATVSAQSAALPPPVALFDKPKQTNEPPAVFSFSSKVADKFPSLTSESSSRTPETKPECSNRPLGSIMEDIGSSSKMKWTTEFFYNKPLMKELQESYEKKNPQNKAFVIRKLANLKYKEGSSMAEHLNVFQSLVNQLSTMKIAFDDEVQALFLLSSLPDSWNTMVVTLSNNAPNGKLTMNMVKESIFNEETRRKGFELAPSLSGFMSGSTTFRAQLTNVSLKLANVQGKTFKLTPSMLRGQALRSMEVVCSAELMLSVQDDHKFESRSDATSSDAHGSQEQGIVEENGLAEPCVSSDVRYPVIDSDLVMPFKDSLVSNEASDSVVQNGVSQPQYKRAFRMSALEDYVDTDDEDDLPSNGIASPPLLEVRKEQEGAHLTNSKPSSAGELKLVKPEIQQEVGFTSSMSSELKCASSTGAERSIGITTPTSEEATVSAQSAALFDQPKQTNAPPAVFSFSSKVADKFPFLTPESSSKTPETKPESSSSLLNIPAPTGAPVKVPELENGGHMKSPAPSNPFGASWQTPKTSLFGSTPTSASPSTGFAFGASSSAPSSSPAFPSAQPVFGNSPGNNFQMNGEDSRAEDPVQSTTPSVPVFGQPSVAAPSPSGFMFASTAPAPAIGNFTKEKMKQTRNSKERKEIRRKTTQSTAKRENLILFKQ